MIVLSFHFFGCYSFQHSNHCYCPKILFCHFVSAPLFLASSIQTDVASQTTLPRSFLNVIQISSQLPHCFHFIYHLKQQVLENSTHSFAQLATLSFSCLIQSDLLFSISAADSLYHPPRCPKAFTSLHCFSLCHTITMLCSVSSCLISAYHYPHCYSALLPTPSINVVPSGWTSHPHSHSPNPLFILKSYSQT